MYTGPMESVVIKAQLNKFQARSGKLIGVSSRVGFLWQLSPIEENLQGD